MGQILAVCVGCLFFKDTEPSPLQDSSSVRQQGGLPASSIKQISSPAYELAETTTGRLSKVTYAEFVQLAIISTTVA